MAQFKQRLYEFSSGIETSTQPDAGTPTLANDLITLSYVEDNLVFLPQLNVMQTVTTSISYTHVGGRMFQDTPVIGSGGVNQNVTTITAGTVHGFKLKIRGCSNTATVTLKHGTANLFLNGDRILYLNTEIVLCWHAAQNLWIEESFNAIGA